MEIVAGYVIKALILPPGVNLLAGLFAFQLRGSYPRTGRFVAALAFLTLWVWCTPVVSAWLAHTLEDHQANARLIRGDAAAIVVLGGGSYTDAPEYGEADTVGGDTLERIRYGALLARRLTLPVAVTGGAVIDRERGGVGHAMAEVLNEEFRVPVHWVETRSRNTAQNASELRALLPSRRIILVTHALHMKRSVEAFERVGFAVTPAPMGFRSRRDISYRFFQWLPSVAALTTSRAVLHEWLGIGYYRLRY